jgi:hypothetical protein
MAVPAETSVTVTVHEVATPMGTEDGAHVMSAVVVRLLTVTSNVLLLPRCTALSLKVAVMVCVLAPLGVYVALHDATPVESSASVHVPVKLPVPLLPSPTVPEGVMAVPAPALSVTVTVHELPWLMTMEPGEQPTLVLVERLLTVTSNVLLLPRCTALSLKVAVMVCVLAPLGVYVALHDATPVESSASVQEPLNPPVPLVAKPTVPEGVMAVPAPALSVTVTVHELPWLMTMEPGEQLTLVLVERLLTEISNVPLLPPCVLVSENVAVMVCVLAPLGV